MPTLPWSFLKRSRHSLVRKNLKDDEYGSGERILSDQQELEEDNVSENKTQALISWYFDPIPSSFHAWLKSALQGKADKTWELNDDLTIEMLCENVEFLLRHQKMTKKEKQEKIISTLRAANIDGSKEVSLEIMNKVEMFTIEFEQIEQKRTQSQRQLKEIHVSPGSPRKSMTRQRSNTLS